MIKLIELRKTKELSSYDIIILPCSTYIERFEKVLYIYNIHIIIYFVIKLPWHYS